MNQKILLSCVLNFYLFSCIFAGSLGGNGTTPPYYAFQPYNNVFYNGQIAQGLVRMDNGFTVVGTSATMDTCLSVSGAIDLRNVNTIILSSDLTLDHGVTLSSGGRIYGYDRAVVLNGDLTIPTGGVIHIGGRIVIDGQGNKLILGKSAQLFVDAGATLTLRNLVLQNTQNNPGNPPVLCATGGTAAYCSNLCLDNVELALADNFYFNCGQMFIHNDVSVTGTSALVYCSCQPSFITSGAQLYFDVGTTFSVAPSTFTACPYTQNLYYGNQFIQMADATSTIIFNGSSFFTTSTGLRLTTGAVLFDNRVSLNSNASFTLASTSTSQATYINGINTGAQPNSVSWSPDGRFLAVCNLSGSNLQVFKFNGSSMPTQVGVNVSISTPSSSVSWSPDGRFIAVVSGGELVSEILSIFSFNGLNTPTPVGSVTIVAGETPNSVSWSPDGRFLAVASGSVTSGDGSLSMFSFNGVGNPSLVGSQSTAVSPFSASWSPDGRFLAVVNSVTNTLQIFSFNGIGDPVQVTTGTGVATGGSSPISVTWSPDGRFLAFVNSTSNTLKIFSFSGSGNLILVGTANTATSSAASSSVTWSPDGRFLTVVFGSATTGALQIFSFRGSGNPTWFGTNISTGLDPFSVSWSPDERFLAVVNAIGHTLQIFGVNYIVNRTPPQALSNSIVFGNSSLGSSYDTTVDFLSGSNVILNGQINFDNVN